MKIRASAERATVPRLKEVRKAELIISHCSNGVYPGISDIIVTVDHDYTAMEERSGRFRCFSNKHSGVSQQAKLYPYPFPRYTNSTQEIKFSPLLSKRSLETALTPDQTDRIGKEAVHPYGVAEISPPPRLTSYSSSSSWKRDRKIGQNFSPPTGLLCSARVIDRW